MSDSAPTLDVSPRVRIPYSEFTFSYARSSGPGGQNVNKVNTKVYLRWPVAASSSLPEDVRQRFLDKYRRRIAADGDLVLSSERYRDQKRNQADCLEKLRSLLSEVGTPPKRRRPTKPTKASKRRRAEAKQQRSQTKRLRRPPAAE